MRPVLAMAALALLAAPARAERLPIRSYGASEGLAGDHVRFIHQDAQGFLWLATNAGVSRFDGHEFRNYGASDGLPVPSARKIVEAPDGTLWVLTRERVARRLAGERAEGRAFTPFAPPGLAQRVGDVFDLALAPGGDVLLAGTRGAALVRTAHGGRLDPVALGPAHSPELPAADHVWAAAYDRQGALWAVRTYCITRIGPEGTRRVLPLRREQLVSSGWGWLPSIVVGRSGTVWLLRVDAVWRLAAGADGAPVVAEVLDAASLPERLPRALHEGPDGTLWIGAADGSLLRGQVGDRTRSFAVLRAEQGIPDVEVFALTSDAQGNLWGGTAVAGVFRLARDGLTSWGAAEGLRPPSVAAIEDDPVEGVLAVLSELRFAAFRNGKMADRWQVLPEVAQTAGWGGHQLLARAPDGRLWVATAAGVALYPPGTRVRDLDRRKPERRLDERSGLPGPEVHRLFAASDGTVWIGLMHVAAGVCRMDARGEGLRCFGAADGLPATAWGVAFEEDRAGGIWIGLYEGGVYRYRAGRLETWPEIDPAAQTTTRSIRRDEAGRLWIAGSPGLVRVARPEVLRPSFRRLTAADGLSSLDTTATTEDGQGRLYVGGVHGLDRLDPASGTVRRFTTADGLPSNRIGPLHRDRSGAIWVGTSRGVARLLPRAGPKEAPPRVFLTGVVAAGRGRDPGRSLTLGNDERTVEFAFTSPSFRVAEAMRFQWRLLGSSDSWSPLSPARTITFAGLSPGSYRFEVRAVDGEGLRSAPVGSHFTIHPPLWRRGWFLALAGALAAAGALAVHRARVFRLLELERVRTRIATDLHDDVGASLSQIAVLSQAARRQAARGAAEAGGSLERITDLSGNVVDAMSDVVWSINPARDRMSDLVHRMRRFAVDLFSEADAELHLDLPEDADDARIDPDVRRQIYLVFKEALRNAARHSGATRVEVGLRREGSGLALMVRDDGRGLGERTQGTGFGLQNMRRRAEAVGGTLAVRPRPQGGTEVVLTTGTQLRDLSKRMGAWLRRAP